MKLLISRRRNGLYAIRTVTLLLLLCSPAVAEPPTLGVSGVLRVTTGDQQFGQVTSLEAWEASGRKAVLAPGEYVISEPIVLGHGDALVGHSRATVIKADPSLADEENPPAMIVSEGIEELSEQQYSWTHRGVPMAIEVRNLTLVGPGISGNPRVWEKGKPDRLHGIKLLTGMGHIHNVVVCQMPGTCIRTQHFANINPRLGQPRPWDMSKTTVDDVWVHTAYRGVEAYGGDVVLGSISASGIRDAGLTTWAACNLQTYHGYGCGIGLWSRKALYADIVQTENCGIGWKNDGFRVNVRLWRAFDNGQADAEHSVEPKVLQEELGR